MNLHRRPLFLIVLAYILGIVCAAQPNLHPIFGILIVICVLALGFIVPQRVLARPVVFMLAAVFAIGFMRTSMYRQVPEGDISGYAEGKMVHLTGAVISDVEPVDHDYRFVIRTARVKTYTSEFPANGLVMVRVRRSQYTGEQGTVPSYGETVRIHGRLTTPQGASNPGGFEYGQYLARKHIFCALSAYTNEVTVLRPPARSARWIALRFSKALGADASRLFPPVDGALLLGILLGNYAALPISIQAAFMRSGTMHLLAASGYNCAVVIGIFGFVLRRMTVPRAFTHWLLIGLVWAFTLVVGPSPSIIRAAVMVTIFLAAYLIWRAPDTLNIVCASILAILAINPMYLYDIGFQLSYAAVFGIVTIMPLIDPGICEALTLSPRVWEKRSGWLSRWITFRARDIVFVVVLSAAAGLWTWPISAYYFNYFSVVSVAANALVALLVVLMTYFGIPALILGWIWLPLGKLAAIPTIALTQCMLRIVIRLGMQPWSSVSVQSPHPILIAAYYLILFGVTEYAYRIYGRPKREN